MAAPYLSPDAEEYLLMHEEVEAKQRYLKEWYDKLTKDEQLAVNYELNM